MAKGTGAQKLDMPSAQSIAASAAEVAKGGLPPVDTWNPPFCGDIDMRIARDGTWFYEGSPIGLAGLVKLFSSIIRRDGDDYFLVTPVEKVGITVEDAPFVAVDFDVVGDDLVFRTHVDDIVTLGPDNPLRVEFGADGEPSPYILVRRNLEALIDRKSFYRLVDQGEKAQHEGEGWFGVRSAGAFFAMMRAADL